MKNKHVFLNVYTRKQCRPIRFFSQTVQTNHNLISNRALILRAQVHFIIVFSQLVLLCPSFLISELKMQVQKTSVDTQRPRSACYYAHRIVSCRLSVIQGWDFVRNNEGQIVVVRTTQCDYKTLIEIRVFSKILFLYPAV